MEGYTGAVNVWKVHHQTPDEDMVQIVDDGPPRTARASHDNQTLVLP